MVRISTLKPFSFDESLSRPASKCTRFMIELGAEDGIAKSIDRPPEAIAGLVLENKGIGLRSAEKRELANLVLAQDYQRFNPDFAKAVLAEHANGARFWNRLIASWIREFPTDLAVAPLISRSLKKNLNRSTIGLAEIVRKHGLLDLPPKLNGIARDLLLKKLAPAELRHIGISSDGNSSTKLARSILQELANGFRRGNPSIEELEAFRALVAPDGKISISNHSIAMVGLILGSRKFSAGSQTVREISSIVEAAFGDPVAESGRWPSVGEDLGGFESRKLCLEIAKRWNVFRSIDVFFKIIGRVVESDHKHQFPIRQAFWMTFFDRGEVTDARVILGSRARNEIERLKQSAGGDYLSLDYSYLSGGPSDQCALLLKVGRSTVMEFSHSGRARIWGPNDQEKLQARGVTFSRKGTYKAEELRAPCPEKQMFRHDPKGAWRSAAHSCLAKLNGRATRI